jgi:hypothetical protein
MFKFSLWAACVALTLFGFVCSQAQNVGIGTATPQQRLHVRGHIRTDSSYIGLPVTLTPTAGGVATTGTRASTYLIQDNAVAVTNTLTLSSASIAGQFAYIYNADAQDVTFGTHTIAAGTMGSFLFDGTTWRRTVGGGAATADNLGNHTATQNIQLQSNWLSNDGGNEGIRVENNGYVGVGIVPTHPFHVFGQGSGVGAPVTDAANSAGAICCASGPVGNNGLAQYFTALNTGTLNSISVMGYASAGGVTAVLDLYSGTTCAAPFIVSSATSAVPNGSATLVTYNFPTTPAITAGAQYTFRVRFITGAGNGWTSWGLGNPYSGGIGYDQTCAGLWNSGNVDLQFSVNVTPNTLVNTPLVWTTNPYLGVGTLTPTERLHVNGNTRLDGTFTLLADTVVHPSSGIITLTPTRSTYIVKTTAAAANATRLNIADGTYPGQQLLLICRNGNASTNAFRLTEAACNVQIVGTILDLNANDSIQLVWNGQDWVQVGFADND